MSIFTTRLTRVLGNPSGQVFKFTIRGLACYMLILAELYGTFIEVYLAFHKRALEGGPSSFR